MRHYSLKEEISHQIGKKVGVGKYLQSLVNGLKYSYKGVDNMLELEQLRTSLEPYKVKLTEMGNSL